MNDYPEDKGWYGNGAWEVYTLATSYDVFRQYGEMIAEQGKMDAAFAEHMWRHVTLGQALAALRRANKHVTENQRYHDLRAFDGYYGTLAAKFPNIVSPDGKPIDWQRVAEAWQGE